jgi:uncharacterized protein (DUF1330 family)
MAAFVIVDIAITDPVGYQEYKTLAESTVIAYSGRYIARGGHAEALEGEWMPNRLVILEFPSVERAKEWLYSTEYSGPRQLRHKTARTNMVVVEGL